MLERNNTAVEKIFFAPNCLHAGWLYESRNCDNRMLCTEFQHILQSDQYTTVLLVFQTMVINLTRDIKRTRLFRRWRRFSFTVSGRVMSS